MKYLINTLFCILLLCGLTNIAMIVFYMGMLLQIQNESNVNNLEYIITSLLYYNIFWHYGGILYIICLTNSNLISSIAYWILCNIKTSKKYNAMFNKITMSAKFIDKKICTVYTILRWCIILCIMQANKFKVVRTFVMLNNKMNIFVKQVCRLKTRDLEMEKIEEQIKRMNEMNNIINKYNNNTYLSEDAINNVVNNLRMIGNDE